MNTLDDILTQFRADLAELLNECERFAYMCRSSRLQRECADQLKSMLKRASQTKKEAIEAMSEDCANEILAYECMLDAFVNEFQMYIALKESDPNKAWTHLVNSQMAARCAIKAHSVGATMESHFIPRLNDLERLLFPKQAFMSVGFVSEGCECSICERPYGECDHIQGRPYMGRMCAGVVKKAELDHVSIVDSPADKRCRVHAFTDRNGLSVDSLSLEPANITLKENQLEAVVAHV